MRLIKFKSPYRVKGVRIEDLNLVKVSHTCHHIVVFCLYSDKACLDIRGRSYPLFNLRGLEVCAERRPGSDNTGRREEVLRQGTDRISTLLFRGFREVKR